MEQKADDHTIGINSSIGVLMKYFELHGRRYDPNSEKSGEKRRVAIRNKSSYLLARGERRAAVNLVVTEQGPEVKHFATTRRNFIFRYYVDTLSNHGPAVEHRINCGYRPMKSSWSSFRWSAFTVMARDGTQANFISDLYEDRLCDRKIFTVILLKFVCRSAISGQSL